ncbi:hypothetical protein CKO15_04245 [Halorhodospira abdelmalekii]|nr:hypothetical protein [Halorhodospira abdelmalekii]
MQQLHVGYSALEDRLALRLTLASGELRAVWLPRRVVSLLLQRVTEALRRTHPAVTEEGGAAHDEVLALEHLAALSELAGQRQDAAARRQGEETEAADQSGAAASAASAAGEGADTALSGAAFTGHFLVSEDLLEVRDGALIVALLGQPLRNSEPGLPQEAAPIAAMSLSRAQAHELLRMLGEHTKAARWGLQQRLSWTEYFKLGRGIP